MLGAALLFASSAAGQESTYVVRQNWSCSLDEARAIAQPAQLGKEQMLAAVNRFTIPPTARMDRAGCWRWDRLQVVQVKEVLETYYDWAGDPFYIVRIGHEGKRTYTFAWPRFNTDLPMPPGADMGVEEAA